MFFHISAQNIDCGYSLEPPWWGSSNEYPQSMFLSRNKKNNVYPCKPQFYCKWGLRVPKLYRHFSWWLDALTIWPLGCVCINYRYLLSFFSFFFIKTCCWYSLTLKVLFTIAADIFFWGWGGVGWGGGGRGGLGGGGVFFKENKACILCESSIYGISDNSQEMSYFILKII